MSFTTKATQFSNTLNSNNQLNSEDLPVKDHNNICSSTSTSSNSSSRSNSSANNAAIDPKKQTPNLAEAYSSINHHHHHHLQQQQQKQHDHLDSNLFRQQYSSHQMQQPSNTVYTRQYSSQMELPLCNSTSLASSSNLLAGRNIIPNSNIASYLSAHSSTINNYSPGNTIPIAYNSTQQYHHHSHPSHLHSNRFSTLSLNTPGIGCIHEQPLYSSQNLANSYMTEATATTAPMFTASSNITGIYDSLHRRDTEIERLKMRIILLEQQNENSAKNLTSNNSELRMTNIEYNHALNREINMGLSKDEFINKLEATLNAKEYEIEELMKKHGKERDNYESELAKQSKLIKIIEEDHFNDKNRLVSTQKENEKLQSKLNECNEYISRLPTLDEVKDKERLIADLQFNTESLNSKLKDQEKKCMKAKQYIRDKTTELKQLQEKLQLAELETDKLRIQFETYREDTKEVGQLLEKREENARLIGENEMNKKLILALQENQKNTNARHECKVNELKEKIKHEINLVENLEKSLQNKEQDLLKLQNSVKSVSQQNQTLMEENLNLTEKVKALNAAISPETLKSLYKLFEELNGCTQDLNNLVTNCIDLYNKQEVSINSLLGYEHIKPYNSFEIDFKENGMLSLMDNERLFSKTKEIKECRQKLIEIRKMVSDQYADSIGSNASCITQ